MQIGSKAFLFWQKYEHHLGVGALMLGFVFDLWAADRPDIVFNNILLLSYLFIAGSFIIFLNLRTRPSTRLGVNRPNDAEPLLLLLVLQFCFGGLASNLLILYGKSGTLTVDAFFLAFLAALVFGNEFLRNRYAQLRFNVGIYYMLLLAYSAIAVPIFLTYTIGAYVFLLSGILSLAWMAAFLSILFSVVFGKDRARLFGVSSLVLGIFLVFNALYFLNVIPPVPLSLKDIGIYHSLLARGDGGYAAIYEQAPWWQFWRDTSAIYTLGVGQSAFCFSSA